MHTASSDRKRVDRRAAIVAVGRDIAQRDGVSALTVRAVSGAAGVGVGTLRHYFPTQRALLEAVVADVIADELDDRVVLDRDRSPGERLAHGVLQFLPEELGAPQQLDAWFAFYVAALSSQASADARSALEASVAAARAHVRRWLSALADDGHLASERVDDVTTGLIALVNGLVLEVMTPGSPATINDARRIAGAAARAVVGEVAR